MVIQQIDTKKYRGTLLPGSEIQQSATTTAVVTKPEEFLL